MKFKALTVLMALATSGTAMAACTDTFNLGVMGPPAMRVFGNEFGSRTDFQDCYNFTLNGDAASFGTTLEFDRSMLRNIDITSVSLSGGSLGSAIVDTSPTSFSFSNLAAGVYQFVVSGSVTGSNLASWIDSVGYSGTISTTTAVAAPVPEPETYALLAAGLLAVSWTVRRRTNQA